ncbi:MAG: 50S ribosomal protein L28 [Magnetococcales bacterium]|nr:50S ribosomal protein L28 [Magnetococcales bacterium]MBF0155600.1 50S ribosomal protein L28 [Magnetococcales bacterium]
MSAKFTLGGKPPQTGHKVSHSNRKAKRKWKLNIQEKSLFSLALGRFIRMNLSTGALRSIDLAGGLDGFLLKAREESLAPELKRLRRIVAERSTAGQHDAP